jgi:hypothetical protein
MERAAGRKWTMTLVLPIGLIASQAIAEKWITVGSSSDGTSVSIDKDSIRRGSDGLVYWTDELENLKSENAADCQKRIYYPINLGGVALPDWRASGQTNPSSASKAELKYACANAG